MTKCVLVGTDFSDASVYALRAAARLASASGQRLVIAHVIEDLPDGEGWMLLVESPEEIAGRVRAERMDRLRQFAPMHVRGLIEREAISYMVAEGSPAEAMVELARSLDADRVVVGCVGRGLVVNALLGSVASELVRRTEREVMVVPAHPVRPKVDRILVPLDGSELARQALASAMALARSSGAKLDVIHVATEPVAVVDPLHPVVFTRDMREALIVSGKRMLSEAIEGLGAEDLIAHREVVFGEPAYEIRRWAYSHRSDLICMGTNGRRGFSRFVLGNTAERSLRQLPCPMLVVPMMPHGEITLVDS